jgi:hypothetical protein
VITKGQGRLRGGTPPRSLLTQGDAYAGGAKNSSGRPSGSRKDSPDP